MLRGRPPAADPSRANPASGATLPLHSLPSRHGVRGPELNAAQKAGRGQGRTPALLPSGSEAFSSPATKRPAFRTKETSRCLRSRPGTLAWKSRSASASLRAQGQPCSAPRYETNPVRVTARRTSRNGDAAAACLGPDGNPAVGDALGARGRPGTKRGFPGSPRSTDSVVPAGFASRFVSREGPKRVCLSPTRGETRRWSTLRHGVRPFKGFRVSRAVLNSEKIRIYAAGETGQLRPGFVKICVCAETAIEFLCWAVAAALSAAHCACGFACGLQGRGSRGGDGVEKDLV